MLTYALEGDRVFGVGYVEENVEPESVRETLTVGLIEACVTHDDGTSHLALQGLQRVEVIGWEQVLPFRIASVVPVPDVSTDGPGEQQLADELLALCRGVIDKQSNSADSLMLSHILDEDTSPDVMSYRLGHVFIQDPELRQEYLEMFETKLRLQTLIRHLKEISL